MKLTKKQKEMIEKAKKEINSLSEQQGEIYSNLCEALKIDTENDHLFDYIFNNFGSFSKIEKNHSDKLLNNGKTFDSAKTYFISS